MKVGKLFTFDAAHFLPNYEGKCSRMHGHTYHLEVVLEGAIDSHSGMVVDFAEMSQTIRKYLDEGLDHRILNDTVPNPTAELLAAHIGEDLNRLFHGQIVRVRVWETPTSYAEHDIHR